MDKRLKYCCESCVFLDKQNKIDEDYCYTYGCLRTPRQHEQDGCIQIMS